MPDTYVKLPNGQYVQIPEGATPEQLMQMKIKLAGMRAAAAPADNGGVQGLVNDPEFLKLSAGDQKRALAGVSGDNAFSGLSDADLFKFTSTLKTRSTDNVGNLSDQDLQDLKQIDSSLPAGDPRKIKIQMLLASQRPATPTFASAAAKAKAQTMSQMTGLMDASGYPELTKAKPTGRVGHVAAPEPDVEGTLGAIPAVGGTIGGAVGGVPGAALGGAGGEALKNLIQMAATGQPTKNPVSDIAGQGIIQGVFEGGGQLLSKAGQMVAPAALKRAAGGALKGRLDAAGKAIDEYLGRPEFSTATVDIAQPVNGILDREIARAEKVGAKSLADRLGELKDSWNTNYDLESPSLLEANQFRRDVGDITSFAGEANKTTINKIQREIVGAVGGKIVDAAPGVRELNDAYSNLVATRAAIKQSGKKLTSGLTGTALAAGGKATQTAGAAIPQIARAGQTVMPQSASDLLEQIKSLSGP